MNHLLPQGVYRRIEAASEGRGDHELIQVRAGDVRDLMTGLIQSYGVGYQDAKKKFDPVEINK